MSTELKEKLYALFSLPSHVRSFKDIEDHVWEKGFDFLCTVFSELLKQMDDTLFEMRPRSLEPKQVCTKHLDTVVGTVTMVRRRYKDENGRSVYLLDDVLGLKKRQRISPGLIAQCVEQATEMSFRRVVEQREELGLPSISHGAVHHWTRELGKRRRLEDDDTRRRLFEEGETVTEGHRDVAVLFHEVDGIFVHAQREERRRIEIKTHVVHEGWEPRYGSGGKGWKLKERKVYAAVPDDAEAFWEEVLAVQGEHIDWSSVTLNVLNGDGAAWIDSGKEHLSACYRQLDRFHLFRDIRQAFPDDHANRLIGAICRGAIEEVLDTIEGAARDPKLPKTTRERRLKLWRHLKTHREALLDYRTQLRDELPEGQIYRGLGAAEGSVDKYIANRMKKRGMSWTRAGADAMARLRSLRLNGALRSWLNHQFEPIFEVEQPKENLTTCRSPLRAQAESWLDHTVPALSGPSSGKIWVKVLRTLIAPKFEVA